MLYWYLRMRQIVEEQKGQDLAEYALLIGLIALVVIVGVTAVGTQVNIGFSNLGSRISTWFGGS